MAATAAPCAPVLKDSPQIGAAEPAPLRRTGAQARPTASRRVAGLAGHRPPRPLLASRELILERFLRGLLEGIHTIETQPDVARALLAREGLSTPSDSALVERLDRVPYLSADNLADAAEKIVKAVKKEQA